MPVESPTDLLDVLLAGEKVSASELDTFIAANTREGLHHDFKHGTVLEKPKPKPANTVREYLSSFANSDGGVLVVGVSESDESRTKTREVTGAKSPGGKPLDEWAASTMLEISSHFSIQPRFQVVVHPKGNVLLCAVARSAQLVPVVESRQWRYFLRSHDATFEAPPYLVSDLVLGRRNHPVLELELASIVVGKNNVMKARAPGEQCLPIDVIFRAENVSLMTAEEVTVGIVSWRPTEPGKVQPISKRLLYDIVQVEPEQPHEPPHHLKWSLHHVNTLKDRLVLPTFSVATVNVRDGLRLPYYNGLDSVSYSAVYLLSKDAPAKWYSLACETPMPANGPEYGPRNAQRCKLSQMPRPRVYWSRSGRAV